MKTRGGGKGGGCLRGKHRQRKRLDPKPVKGRTGTQGPGYLFSDDQNRDVKRKRASEQTMIRMQKKEEIIWREESIIEQCVSYL